jgi:hypothetical protein
VIRNNNYSLQGKATKLTALTSLISTSFHLTALIPAPLRIPSVQGKSSCSGKFFFLKMATKTFVENIAIIKYPYKVQQQLQNPANILPPSLVQNILSRIAAIFYLSSN